MYLMAYARGPVATVAGPAACFPRPTSSLHMNLETKLNTFSDAAGARRGSPTRVTRKLAGDVPRTICHPSL